MEIFELGERIKKLRKELGLTQEELAKKAGISRPTLSRIENGYLGAISAASLFKIIASLGYTVEIKPRNPFIKRISE